MPEQINLKGHKYHSFEVLYLTNRRDSVGRLYWRCKCECGNEKDVIANHLRGKRPISCGCKKRNHIINMKTSHGQCGTKLYEIFRHMVARCFDEKHESYCNYGGRDITLCQDWNPKHIGFTTAFLNFKYWADRHEYQDGLTIDRFDNENHYCPGNCYFSTLQHQLNHTRRTKYISYNGITKNIKQWSKDPVCKVSYSVLRYRINNNWPVEKALTLAADLTNPRGNNI